MFQNCNDFESQTTGVLSNGPENGESSTDNQSDNLTDMVKDEVPNVENPENNLPKVLSVNLVNNQNEDEIIILNNNMEIDLSKLSGIDYHLDAKVSENSMSVLFDIDGVQSSEIDPPYTSTINLKPGKKYSIKIISYDSKDASGTASEPLSLSFSTKSQGLDLLLGFEFSGSINNVAKSYIGTATGKYLTKSEIKLESKIIHTSSGDKVNFNLETNSLSNGQHELKGSFTFSDGVETKVVEKSIKFVVENKENMNEVNPNAYFVSLSGNDNNDGKSEAKAFRTIKFGVTKLNAGETLYVKAGNYGAEFIRFPRSGSKGSPITLEGYRSVPGDNPTIEGFDHKSKHDATVMPLLKGSMSIRVNNSNGAIIFSSRSYINIKNFQVTEYRYGVYGDSSQNSIVDNVIVSLMGDPNKYSSVGIRMGGSSGETKNGVIRNSVVVNSSGEGINMSGDNNLLENSRVYASIGEPEEAAMDYYVIFNNSTNSIIRNSYIERVGNLKHGGHGFTFKGNNTNNLVENCTAVNLAGGGFVARHRGTKNNTFRNIVVKNSPSIGIMARDGASKNLFENVTIENSGYGIVFMDTTEDGGLQTGSDYNTFRNIKMKNIRYAAISFSDYTFNNTTSTGNIMENIEIDGAKFLIYGEHYSKNNILRNSTLKNVERFGFYRAPRVAADVPLTLENITKINSGF